MPYTHANGKICYLEIPSTNIPVSSEFYRKIFDWNIRRDNSGRVSFDDAIGEVSGMWTLDRKASREPGIVISIMVDSVADTLQKIVENGGEIVRPIGADFPEITAHFRDPSGNVLALYQELS
jgi:predicted enzyme related to lactoylglutathione lyase